MTGHFAAKTNTRVRGNAGSGFQPGNLDLEKKYNYYTHNNSSKHI